MEAVHITRREIEIRFDDEDEKLLKEGWYLEQRVQDKTLMIMILPPKIEVPG